MGFFDDLKKKAESVVSDAVDWTAQAAKDTADWTTQAAKDTVDWTAQAAKDTADWTEQATKDAVDWTAQAAKDTADWTTQAAKDTVDWTTQTASDVADFATETWENKDKYLEDIGKWTTELPNKLKDYTDNFNIQDFWNKITTVALKAGQEVVFMALTCFYAVADKFNGETSQDNKEE